MSDGAKHPIPTDFDLVPSGMAHQPQMARAVMRVIWDEDKGVFRTVPCLMVAQEGTMRFHQPGQPLGCVEVPFGDDGTVSPDRIRAEIARVFGRAPRLVVDA